MACYELLDEIGTTSEQQNQLMAAFARAMAAYQAGAFEQAAARFEEAAGLEPRTATDLLNPSRVFRSRCQRLQDAPPDHWDGVWELTDK